MGPVRPVINRVLTSQQRNIARDTVRRCPLSKRRSGTQKVDCTKYPVGGQ